MRLGKSDLLRALKELAAALPSGKDRDLDRLAEGYLGALEDCSLDELRYAVQEVIKEDRFFPPASRLRRLAFDYRKTRPQVQQGSGTLRDRYDFWARDGKNGPCPVCGSLLEWPEGRRATITHDHQQHDLQGVPYSF